ncbi:hypothetical protein [Hydrogenophaga sp.]|uniref:hypothetical protein n=1 Tax=Hydrogenophaga sp. TaxID=1904254 RepID=UPI001984A394|nr:hypothetical protein [Hydrogenophaga sp.]MBD3893139.1 hypothetical protein [Hydrogenophaga sp.]
MRAPRRGSGGLPLLALALTLVQAPGVWAQAAAVAADAAPGSAAAAFEDRLIEGLPPEPDPQLGPAFDRSGMPRFLRLETRLGTQPFEQRPRAGVSYAVYGLLETPNHGSLSIDGRYAPDLRDGTLTLRQLGLPLAGGWRADHAIGIVHPPSPGITRLPTRVQLPTTVLQGLSGEWENLASGWQLQASSGQPGRLEGSHASGWRAGAGRRSALALQWQLGRSTAAVAGPEHRGWTLALKHEAARGVAALEQPALARDLIDADSTLIALRHETQDQRVQGQFVRTRAGDVDATRSGFWIDAEWDAGARRHGLGLYRLQPQLSWAQNPMVSNVMGAYARTRWRSRQWSAEASLDWFRSLDARASAGLYASTQARWRLDRHSSLGAGFALRHSERDAWTGFGDWRWRNAWGNSGLRLELTGGAQQRASQLLSYDQEWQLPQGFALSSSLGLGRYEASRASGEPAQHLWSLALSFTAPLTSRSDLRGHLNTEHDNTGKRRHGLNLGANWRIASRWSLEGTLNHSSGRSRVRTPLDPLAPPLPELPRIAERSFQVMLRYQFQAGSRSAPLGGLPLDGGGRILGTVYFDANRSGTQEAGEAGVPDVLVLLDNRFTVRTDAQGRFEFPFVAAGPRRLTVRNDTLPLPWNVADDGQAQVEVWLRGTSQISFAVQRSD